MSQTKHITRLGKKAVQMWVKVKAKAKAEAVNESKAEEQSELKIKRFGVSEELKVATISINQFWKCMTQNSIVAPAFRPGIDRIKLFLL